VSQVFWCNEHENESILSEMDEIDEISQFWNWKLDRQLKIWQVFRSRSPIILLNLMIMLRIV
jgi:hypothetical protein